MDKPLMTVDEIADYLGKCVAWVYRNKTEIPGYYKIGKSIFFNRKTFMAHCEGVTPAEPVLVVDDVGRHGIG